MYEVLVRLSNTAPMQAMHDAHWMLWPALEFVHFMGMCLLFGGIIVLDLRLLGLIRQASVVAVERIIPLVVIGFLLNLVTGVIWVIERPDFYFNTVFRWKMLFILLAGLNVVLYYTVFAPRAALVQAGENTPLVLKSVGAVSLVMWSAVIIWGRFIAFY